MDSTCPSLMVERNVPVELTEDVCQFGKALKPYRLVRNVYPTNRFCCVPNVITSQKTLRISL